MNHMKLPQLVALVVLLCVTTHFATAQTITASRFTSRPDSWLSSDEGKKQIDAIISWQRPEGGWEKGYSAAAPHEAGKPFGDWGNIGTIDNGHTYTELRLIARSYNATKRESDLQAFSRGLDYLLKAQFPNGGWPQRFPLPDNYGRHITFNDDAMINVMRLLSEISASTSDAGTFKFVDAARRENAGLAVKRGIECILKSQVIVNGKRTVWGQQHDEVTLAPTNARSYELPSLCSSESAGIVRFLMQLERPSAEIQQSIRSAAVWFSESRIAGKRLQRSGDDLIVVDDPAAPPLWSRFYEIDTNRPFFCGRDGVKKYSLAEIEKERRTGYAWLRDWGSAVAADYAKWSAAHPTTAPN